MLDEYVVMPNHVHGIIILIAEANDSVARATRLVAPTPATGREPLGRPDTGHRPDARPCTSSQDTRSRPRGPVPGSIGAIVGQFKSLATKRINRLRGTPGLSMWHRDYYEHIIRDDDALDAIRRYIRHNPAM